MQSLKTTAFLLFVTVIFAACSDAGQAVSSSKAVNATANRPTTYQSTANSSSAANTAAVGAERSKSEFKEVNYQSSPAGTDKPIVDSNKKSEPLPPAVPLNRKIIRNADLRLETESPQDAQAKITATAEKLGGYVIQSSQRSSSAEVSSRDIVEMSVRVPSEKFNESLEEVRKTASRIVEEKVSGQDVTEEFVDLEARLKTKKDLEQRFAEIMKRADTIDEALTVQSRIAEVRGEVEQIEGRMKLISDQASFSTIKVELQTPAAIANSTGFFYQLKQSFGSGLSVAVGFVLVLIQVVVAILPFMLLIVLPAGLGLRYLYRKNRVNRTASEIVKEEIKEE